MNSKNKQETKTTLVKKQEVKIEWVVLNAAGKTLGRFCSEVAKILRGKHKVSFTPNVDMGDGVIVINADKITVTGSKGVRKIYRSYTGHIGGLKERSFNEMMDKDPTEVIYRGVKGMMPKSRLGDQQLRKLRVFSGEKHDIQAQKPMVVEV